MKTFLFTFNGEHLTGSMIIVAETKQKALTLAGKEIKGMSERIQSKNEKLSARDLLEIDTSTKGATVIWDGDY